MASVLPERQSVNGRTALDQMFEEAYRSIEQVLAQRLMLWWEAALTTLLGREPHERRVHVRHGVEQDGKCAQCHSCRSRRFSRNGSRPDQIPQAAGTDDPAMRPPRERFFWPLTLDYRRILAQPADMAGHGVPGGVAVMYSASRPTNDGFIRIIPVLYDNQQVEYQ